MTRREWWITKVPSKQLDMMLQVESLFIFSMSSGKSVIEVIM